VSASSRLRRLLAPSPAFASSEFSLRSSSDAALPLSLASIFLPDLLLPGSFLWGWGLTNGNYLHELNQKLFGFHAPNSKVHA
jgi:hypothetical protein